MGVPHHCLGGARGGPRLSCDCNGIRSAASTFSRILIAIHKTFEFYCRKFLSRKMFASLYRDALMKEGGRRGSPFPPPTKNPPLLAGLSSVGYSPGRFTAVSPQFHQLSPSRIYSRTRSRGRFIRSAIPCRPACQA